MTINYFHVSCLGILNASKYATEKNRNSEINSIYVNRNPRWYITKTFYFNYYNHFKKELFLRNLDWGGYQYKRFGWNLHYPPKDFYHQYVEFKSSINRVILNFFMHLFRCVFKKSKDCLEAYVEHQSGEIIIYVSTDDPALKQYLHE